MNRSIQLVRLVERRTVSLSSVGLQKLSSKDITKVEVGGT